MESNKKLCPYCGEEIMAAAKKCKHCGEWLENNKGRNLSPMTAEGLQKKQPSIVINKAVFFPVLVIASLISTFNIGFESYYLELAYANPSSTFWFSCFITVLIISIIFSIVCVVKRRYLSESLRLLISVEVVCLCAPIVMIIQMNNMDNMSYNCIGYILLATAFLGFLCYFLTKFLSGKQISNIYTFGSIAYVLLTIVIFLIFKNH